MRGAKAIDKTRSLDMSVSACAQRVRSFIRDRGCCISIAQVLGDFEVVEKAAMSASSVAEVEDHG